ncbi:translation initiation factor eIF 4e-like domain-containing protein [Cristinia sonorae]|uniref:Translation initiation factor eIF 4e-like domain-containing protein n=1 Tax=Cristinia sonorae TaxID=1940300 RepID=A0A8K0UG77_9AGAR|nr:translation initiation factor eIF 4e-like domain-containing protein [Cristinia sonorae]
MGGNEDAAPTEYPYLWTPDSEISVKDFLNKHKPSMIQDDGTKPWIWVRKSSSRTTDYSDEAVEEATQYLEEVTKKVESIKNDDSIPVRANKKKGTKSKKEVREEVQNEATEKLQDISVRHKFVSGKWLVFAPTDRVDMVWSAIAASLIEGPLSHTCADVAKVATCPKNETPNYQHVLCLYMPNVYDKDAVTEVMKVLLGKHGMNLMGVKSDLYTAIGLDSKHASGVQSTVWRNTALMKDAEMKELKDKYFADLNASKSTAETKPAADEDAPKESGSKDKPAKPKLKRKAKNDDPFASDDDDSKEEEKKPAKTEKKKAAGKATGSKRSKPDSDDDDEDERPKKKVGKK